MNISILLFIQLNLIYVRTANYCYLPCGQQQHSACEGCGVSKHCLHSLYREFHTTLATRQHILNAHNKIRNALVGGKPLGKEYKLAIAFMAYLNYDQELEKLAFCWLRKCIIAPDLCPRTEQYPNVQQNIHFHKKSVKCQYRIIVPAAIKSWHRELVQSKNLAFECSRPAKPTGYKYGCYSNFSQILYGNNSLVGCGMVKLAKDARCFLACNYAPGYLPTFTSLFDEGYPASKCLEYQEGFPYLCGKQKSSSNQIVEELSTYVNFIIGSILYALIN